MNEREFRKQVLLARIEAHRSILPLELRLARRSLRPAAWVARWAGLDPALVDAAVPTIEKLYHDGLPKDLKHAGPIAALVAALLLAWFMETPGEASEQAELD